MQKVVGLLVLSVGVIWLAGCNPAAAAVLLGDPMKMVPAEYTGLSGDQRTVAIVVYTEESTEIEEPDLRPDLQRSVMKAFDKFSNLNFLSVEQVRAFQRTHFYWTDTPEAELGKELSADMILSLHVEYYALMQPQQTYLVQGRLTCRCSLVDVAKRQTVWEKRDLTIVYPASDAPKSMTVNPRTTKEQLIRQFCEKLVDCFRRHQEPMYE